MIARAGLAAVLVLAAASGASAQLPGGPDDPASARRVLRAVREVMETSERGDARPSARALQDESWIVRVVAAVRLETLGLDRGVGAALREAVGDPAHGPPDANAQPVARARAFAEALAVDTQVPAVDVPVAEALRIVASVVTERLQSGTEEPARKKRLLDGLAAFRDAVDEPAERAWLARRLLGLADLECALRDLSARDPDRAVGRDGEAVFGWYRSVGPFLYWQRAERRFRVDQDARTAATPTADYRRANPWPAGQGPDAPGRPGGPGGR